MMSILRLN